MSQELRTAIANEAKRLGVDPVDLATAISYETAGTFDPWKRGPTTKWGQHRGLIQWGEPQRRKYGVYQGMPIADQMRAAGDYLIDAGVRPGMGLMDIYSAINAGSVGRYGASDAHAGGAPGTVADKVLYQMSGHRKKGIALMGGDMDDIVFSAAADRVADRYPAPPPVPYGGYSDRTPISDVGGDYNPYGDTGGPVAGEVNPAYGFWEAFPASAQSDWVLGWALHGNRAPDPNYKFPDDTDFVKDMHERRIPEQYWGHIMDAVSEGDYAGRVKFVEEDMERQVRLGKMGATGMGVRLLTGMADPTAIAAIALTEGVALPAVAALKLKRLGSIALEAGIVGAGGAAYEAWASRYNPNITDTDIALTFGLGAVIGGAVGAWRYNKALQPEADALTRAGEGFIARAESVAAGRQSAGAAANNASPQFILGDTPYIDIADAPEAALNGWWRPDSAGQNMRSESAITRTLTPHFVEEPVGFKGGGEVSSPASKRGQTIHERAQYEYNTSYVPALRAWAKENNKRLTDDTIAEFDELTFEATQNLSHPLRNDPNIQRAAEANARAYGWYADRIENPGLDRGDIMDGIGSVRRDPTYTPLLSDAEAINTNLARYGRDRMERMVEAAIRAGPLSDLSSDIIKKMAKGYVERLARAQYGMTDTSELAFRLGTKEEFKEALRIRVEGAADRFLGDLEDVDIDRIFQAIDETPTTPSATEGSSKHLKKRTLMDYTNEYTFFDEGTGQMVTMRPLDLFIKNSQVAFQRYSRQMAGRIALAQTKVHHPSTGELLVSGIRSRGDFEKLLNWVRDDWQAREGLSVAQKRAGMERDIANFEYWYRDITGAPHFDQNAPMNKFMRRVGEFNFIRLMNNMGLNQFQEFSRIIGMAGLKAFTQQMPAFRRVINQAGKSIPRKDELLADLQAATGLGVDVDFPRVYSRRFSDDYIGVEKFGALDRMLDKGARVTQELSLMHHIMSLQQKWALKAFSQRLFDMSRKVVDANGNVDLSKLSKMQRRKMETVGLGDEKMARVFQEIQRHATTDGRRLEQLNTANWDVSIKAEFVDTLTRLVDRAVHRNDIGTLNRMMSQPVVRMMTQFRAFIIGSWAKSTLYNLHHMDMRTFATMSLELMSAMGTYALLTGMRATGRPDSEEYLKTHLSPEAIAKAGFARAAFGSMVPAVVDTALMFTPIGPQFGNARASGTATDALIGSPAGDIVKSGARFSSGVIDSVTTGRSITQGELKAGIRAFVPFANWMPAAPILNLAVSGLPEEADE